MITEMIGSIIAEVIVGLAGQLFEKDDKVVTEVKKLRQSLASDPTMTEVLQKTLSSFARELKGDKKRTDRLRTFLVSPEVESIVRQAFALKLYPKWAGSKDDLKEVFQSQLKNSVADISADIGEELFESILEACSNAVSRRLDWVIPKDKNRLLADEISAISAKKAFLSGARYDRELIFDFEKKYRKQVGAANKYIVPPDMNVARRVPIDRLYVPSDILPARRTGGKDAPRVGLDHFLKTAYRSIILGNPGAGKSTFAKKLCHDLATRFDSRPYANRELTPVIITVRDYGSEKKLRSCSIVEFLELKTKSDYQLPTPPTGFFEYLFHHGLTLVIFDGLDELLDTADRQKVSSDVERFTDLYPSVPVMVTSREVGYEQAPLDDRFEPYRISPFNHGQVEDYVGKWFALNVDLTPASQKQKIHAFLQESTIVPDLRSNPLMLALMCNIYRGDGYIPRNRPDVYKKCAEMLFEKWDKGRGIHYQLPFEAHVRPAMHHLAHWIYSNEGLQGGVTEQPLIQEAANYLEQWFESRAEAESAAQKFVEFCRGRAWVFTDTGTMKGGEKLYQFTHRTFLEYFTALYICQTHRSPEDVGRLLLPRIRRREWDIVSQLTYQIKGASFVGDADPLMIGVLDSISPSNAGAKWNEISFVVRCLQFMVPTPQVRRRIVRTLLDLAIEYGMSRFGGSGKDPLELPSETIAALLLCAEDNRATVAEEIRDHLLRVILGPDDARSLVAYEIGSHLTISSSVYGSTLPEQIEDFWKKLSNGISDAADKRIAGLASRFLAAALPCIWRGVCGIDELIQWYGTKSLFVGEAFMVFPHAGMSSLATALLTWTLRGQDSENSAKIFDRRRQLLEACSDSLSGARLPWVSLQEIKARFGSNLSLDYLSTVSAKKRISLLELPPKARFGFILLAAAVSESLDERIEKRRVTKLEQFREISPLLLARVGYEMDSVNECLDKLDIESSQRELILDWTNGVVSFIGDAASLFASAPPAV